MENKINIAELLQNCPNGMELDCTMFDNANFIGVENYEKPICIRIGNGDIYLHLTKFGTWSFDENAKCLIFPKGKTTWEGFQRLFKAGDIVINGNNEHAFIYSGENNNYWECYCGVYCGTRNICINSKQWSAKTNKLRLATEKEKEKLFQVIKDNGYKWNAETKTLEKLIGPQFHEGDWITNGDYTWKVISVDNFDYTLTNQWGEYIEDTIDYVNKAFHFWTINDAKDGDVLFHSDSASNGIFIFKEVSQHGPLQKVMCHCDYDSEDGFCLGENHTCCYTDSKILRPATKEQCDLLFQKMKKAGYKWNANRKTLYKLIEPKFKVGDKVKHKDDKTVITITGIKDDYYFIQYYNIRRSDYQNEKVSFADQDNYELVPNKFDITTLKPFESRVLVRDSNTEKWKSSFWGFYDIDHVMNYPYECCGSSFAQCIPYKGNEHLLSKTDDCDEYYKTWE